MVTGVCWKLSATVVLLNLFNGIDFIFFKYEADSQAS